MKLFNQHKSTFILSTFISCLLLSTYVSAKDVYVSDVLYVPLRSGAGNQFQILHQGLKSGTKLEFVSVDEENGFTQVKMADGKEGWIRSQYIKDQPSAQDQLSYFQNKLKAAQEQLTTVQSSEKSLEAEIKQLSTVKTQLSQDKAKITKELNYLKSVSGNQVNLDVNNKRLIEENVQLKNTLENINIENTRLTDKSDQEWFQLGAGAIILGIIIGFILPMFRSRQKKSGWV